MNPPPPLRVFEGDKHPFGILKEVSFSGGISISVTNDNRCGIVVHRANESGTISLTADECRYVADLLIAAADKIDRGQP